MKYSDSGALYKRWRFNVYSPERKTRMKNFLGMVVFACVAILCGMLLWLARANAAPCFKTAAQKVAFPNVTTIYCSSFSSDPDTCAKALENDIFVNTFACGSVADMTNCNPVMLDGSAKTTACYDVYYCYWDTGVCYPSYWYTQYAPYNQTDPCAK